MSQTSYDRQRCQFVRQVHWHDDYSEMREGLDFVGVEYRERITTCRRDQPPWYGTRRAYWLCSAALLSWPLRLWIGARTAHVKLVVHKRFGRRCGRAGSRGYQGETRGSQRPSLTLCYDAYAPEASRTSVHGVPCSPSASQYDVAPSYTLALMLGTKVTGNMRRSKSAVGCGGLANGGDAGPMQRSSTYNQEGVMDDEEWGDEAGEWGGDERGSANGSGVFAGLGKYSGGNKMGGAGKKGRAGKKRGGETREESMRLLDPMPPLARVAPPLDFPVQRLQRLPRITWPLGADDSYVPKFTDNPGDEGSSICDRVTGLGDSSVDDSSTSNERHRDYGVTYTSPHNRTVFMERNASTACLDASGRPASHEAPPPSYDESMSLRSLGRRVSQAFDRLRSSSHTLLDEQI